MTTLSDLFSNTNLSNYTPTKNFRDGYYKSHLDILLQQAKRNKTIREARIWDYIQVENDPNFSRRNQKNSKKIEKLISDLSIATSLNTLIVSKLQIMNVVEFIPENLQYVLLNMQQLTDTNINLLSNVKQFIPFKQIEEALLSDILSHFDNGDIIFDQIVTITNNVIENQPLYPQIKNGNFKSLLSLGLQNMLPKELSGVFETLSYLDMLDELFDDNDAEKNLLNQLLGNSIDTVKNKQVSNIVTGEYSDIPISYDDPLGVSTLNSLSNEITTAIHNQVTTDLAGAGYTNEQINEIQSVVFDYTDGIVEQWADSGAGLPNLVQVSEGIKNLANNDVVTAITNATQRATETIIDRLDILPKTDTTMTNIDYLINVKKNIESRIQMLKYGTTSEQIDSVDRFLRSVLKNKTYTNQQLQEIYNNLVDVLDGR